MPKERLLNPTLFRRGRFLYLRELLRSIEDLWEAIKMDVATEGIYIFGSHVKGTYSKSSDLDVWVQIKPREGEDLYAIPMILTKTKRMVDPPQDAPKLALRGIDVEVVCSTQKPKPPYFDALEQRLILLE